MDYGIKKIRLREAVNGGILLEVLDPGVASDRVDALAEAIGAVISDCERLASCSKNSG